MNDKIQAGDVEKVKASEEVQRRNAQAVIQAIKEMREAIKTMATHVDSLQNNLMNQKNEITELRRQLALLQQKFYEKGSVSHGN